MNFSSLPVVIQAYIQHHTTHIHKPFMMEKAKFVLNHDGEEAYNSLKTSWNLLLENAQIHTINMTATSNQESEAMFGDHDERTYKVKDKSKAAYLVICSNVGNKILECF